MDEYVVYYNAMWSTNVYFIVKNENGFLFFTEDRKKATRIDFGKATTMCSALNKVHKMHGGVENPYNIIKVGKEGN